MHAHGLNLQFNSDATTNDANLYALPLSEETILDVRISTNKSSKINLSVRTDSETTEGISKKIDIHIDK